MGKKANDKRRELFKKLKESGQLDNPAIRPKKPKKQPEPEVVPKCYCAARFAPLPSTFRRCSDCPELEKP